MNKKVYLLQHIYYYGENNEFEEGKLIGIYSNKEKAENVALKYSNLPGFREYPRDCFIIDEFVINKNYWERGFAEISETKDVPITKPQNDNSVDNTY